MIGLCNSSKDGSLKLGGKDGFCNIHHRYTVYGSCRELQYTAHQKSDNCRERPPLARSAYCGVCRRQGFTPFPLRYPSIRADTRPTNPFELVNDVRRWGVFRVPAGSDIRDFAVGFFITLGYARVHQHLPDIRRVHAGIETAICAVGHFWRGLAMGERHQAVGSRGAIDCRCRAACRSFSTLAARYLDATAEVIYHHTALQRTPKRSTGGQIFSSEQGRSSFAFITVFLLKTRYRGFHNDYLVLPNERYLLRL